MQFVFFFGVSVAEGQLLIKREIITDYDELEEDGETEVAQIQYKALLCYYSGTVMAFDTVLDKIRQNNQNLHIMKNRFMFVLC